MITTILMVTVLFQPSPSTAFGPSDLVKIPGSPFYRAIEGRLRGVDIEGRIIVQQIYPMSRIIRFVPDHDNIWTEPLSPIQTNHKIPFRWIRPILDRVHDDEIVWVTIGLSEPICRHGSRLRPGITLSIRNR